MNKLVIGGLLLLSLVGFTLLVQQQQQTSTGLRGDAFSAWMKVHRKNFSTEETTYRRSIFEDNKQLIARLNAVDSVVYSLNKFAHFTSEEFTALYTGSQMEEQETATNDESTKMLEESDIPPTIDWRVKGAVTSVKSQGACGSCWAFSTVGGVEGLNAIVTKNLVRLSEQQLVDCDPNDNGCHGGQLNHAYPYVVSAGVQSLADYPYVADRGECVYDSTKVVFKPDGWAQVKPQHPKQLAAALSKQPVSVCVDSSHFQHYTHGIMDVFCKNHLNHCVLAVGYNDSAWIVKNSWGPDWGEDGYFRVARSEEKNGGPCGIYKSMKYPTVQENLMSQ